LLCHRNHLIVFLKRLCYTIFPTQFLSKKPIGLSYSQLCEDQQLPNVFAEGLERRLKGKLKPASIKATYTHDNKEYQIEWKMTPLGEKPDAISGAILLGKDVTWEKMYHDHLDCLASRTEGILGSESESHPTVNAYVDDIIYHYENIIAQMPGYVYWKDLEGCYLGVNNNIVRAVKMPSREACIGKTDDFFAKKLGWKDGIAQSFQKNDQMVAMTEQQLLNREEAPFTDAQGKEINPLTNKIPLYNRNKQLQGVLGITIDITEQKKLIKLEQEKQMLQEDFDNIIENMAGYVYWKDRQGVYVKCNKQVARMLDFNSCDEIRGKTDFDIAKLMGWSKEVPERLVRDDKIVMETGIPLLNQEEEPFTDFEGKLVYQLSTRIPLKNKKGEIIGIIGNTLDITDRKRAEKLEKEKQVADKTITQLKAFAGGLAHQITTPLAGITLAYGYIESHLSKLIDAYRKAVSANIDVPKLTPLQIENMETKISLIRERIYKTKYIINHHLMNIKSDHKQLLIDITSIKRQGIKAIVDEALADFPFIDNQRKLIEWRGGEDFQVSGVKILLIHVLNNLIDNAIESIHFSNKPNGKLVIWLEQNKELGEYYLHLKDNGLGLARKGRAELFKPFNTDREGGTGLGLYFCKSVMQAHHGDITVSGTKGEYAQFTLVFPEPKKLERYIRYNYKKLLLAQ